MENTILVVDDIAANRNLLRETLEAQGYEVLLANDGVQALKVVGRVRPDIILLDVNMPGLNGYEVCQKLKAESDTAKIPVIFITANDDADSLVRGFEAGGVDFVSKPFKNQEVLARVKTHLSIHTLTRSFAEKNRELEDEVARRTAAEEAANEANEAKSRFLAFISHEMRAPLNAVIGFSEELTGMLSSDPDSGSYEADRIRRAAAHLLGLINNLLDLSKIEAGKMPLLLEDLDPAEVAEDARRDAEPLAARNENSIGIESSLSIPTIRADKTKLRQVLINLLGNACKFTRSGVIQIRLRDVAADGGPADKILPPDRIQISVSDSGIGMTPDEMNGLFKPYQQASDTTAREYGGTGLGLAISRQICRLMGGDLTVSSEKGKGATFTATIPRRVENPGDEPINAG